MADKLPEQPILPPEIEALVLTLDTFLSLTAFRVNRSLMEKIATASLPAAGASDDGTVIIEDGGVNVANLILYIKGQRYRIAGGAPF